ncbi:HD-GYP domain-containing protein [Candidatus Formimonas warabiya]|uniref:HD-GYP domain-containing protein n=1 Tax=Formimonas warabiya TaxID=1761012 RepID=A0A3G1KQ48_FORW1|nr:HD-GYP domain-containing protein [Candidatus Formimonas warabiya]ATW24581.1 hypothetical protein DCMF_07095 [Candidatus Formimonas warabiya]
MIKEPRISFFDLIVALSNTMDLINPVMVNHQKRVAYIAYFIAEEMGLSKEERMKVLLAGLLHDCGVLSLEEKISALEFDFGVKTKECDRHSQIGYQFLKDIRLLSHVAPLVRYHHVYWNERRESALSERIPLGSHILHLADRVEVLMDKHREILGQVKGIIDKITGESGKMFSPDLVDVFNALAKQEWFWLDLFSPFIDSVLAPKLDAQIIELDLEELLDIAKLFYRIIDFRSMFTATHSAGVAASGEAIARFAGFSEKECLMMRIAGFLHDLGKLAIPSEILEKPGPLTTEQVHIMKSHTYYSYRILEKINGMEVINAWASFHHERLDGSGYPFHLKAEALTLGSRILAVADVFTALTETRPYRQALAPKRVIEILQHMAESRHLDPFVVLLLEEKFAEINSARLVAQEEALGVYKGLNISGYRITCPAVSLS